MHSCEHRTGIMDQIYPMIYFRGNNFYPFAADWAENSHGRTVVAGLGTYFLNSREGGKYGWTIDDIRSEMTAARWLGIGTAHFRSAFFTSNEQGIYNFASLCFAPYPALVPPMKWECSDKPSKPLGLTIVGDRLTISDDRNVGRRYLTISTPATYGQLILNHQRIYSYAIYVQRKSNCQPIHSGDRGFSP